MNSISNFFLSLIGIKPVGEHEIHSVDELRLLVSQSKEGGAIEAENYEIIKNAFDFTDYNARQIMIPRQQIFAFDIEMPVKEIIENILENGYSRIPVFEVTLDNITGIIYAKDVFNAYYRNPEIVIKDLLHPVYYVYETKPISEILTEFQKQHIHLAVVIDEFGGTQGIITLEDILEELVGEIQDEDDNETMIVEKKDENTYIILATHSLNDINDLLPHPFPVSENYTTLSGFLLYNFDKIPKQNDKIVISDYEIIISKIQHRTIQSVILKDMQVKASKDTND